MMKKNSKVILIVIIFVVITYNLYNTYNLYSECKAQYGILMTTPLK